MARRATPGAPTDPLLEEAQHHTELAKMVRFLAEDNGISLARAAYRFILMHDHVTTVVGGFSSQDNWRKSLESAVWVPSTQRK